MQQEPKASLIKKVIPTLILCSSIITISLFLYGFVIELLCLALIAASIQLILCLLKKEDRVVRLVRITLYGITFLSYILYVNYLTNGQITARNEVVTELLNYYQIHGKYPDTNAWLQNTKKAYNKYQINFRYIPPKNGESFILYYTVNTTAACLISYNSMTNKWSNE